MKKILLCSVLVLGFAASKLFAQQTIVMRCYLSQMGGTQRIEVYSPGGKYERIDLDKWAIQDDKEIQLKVSKKIDEINQQGFKLVSFSEVNIGYNPFGLVSTYVFSKE